MLNEEKLNHLEKIQFLKTEHKSLLDKNNALTQEIEQQRKVDSSKNDIFNLETKILK